MIVEGTYGYDFIDIIVFRFNIPVDGFGFFHIACLLLVL